MWLGRRLAVRVLTLLTAVLFAAGIAYLYGIKADADRLRVAESQLTSGCWFCSIHAPANGGIHGTPITYEQAVAAVSDGKAALSGPRGLVCRALGFCAGLDL
jgi:hypothetical protein